MTYNFDPDRWYDNEYAALEARRRSGDVTAEDFDRAIDTLQRRYGEMLDRLDGTYRLPRSSD